MISSLILIFPLSECIKEDNKIFKDVSPHSKLSCGDGTFCIKHYEYLEPVYCNMMHFFSIVIGVVLGTISNILIISENWKFKHGNDTLNYYFNYYMLMFPVFTLLYGKRFWCDTGIMNKIFCLMSTFGVSDMLLLSWMNNIVEERERIADQNNNHQLNHLQDLRQDLLFVIHYFKSYFKILFRVESLYLFFFILVISVMTKMM